MSAVGPPLPGDPAHLVRELTTTEQDTDTTPVSTSKPADQRKRKIRDSKRTPRDAQETPARKGNGDAVDRVDTRKPQTSWTAPELMATEFGEPRWAVPGMLPEGVSLLCGAPKIGKSWLALNLAVAVAAGGRALGVVDVEPGEVLYLALEDTARRLKSRLEKVLQGADPPPRLTVATECPPLPDGGDAQIGAWLARNPRARLVIIDVFARVRGVSPAGLSAYDADYLAMSRMKRLADDYGVAVPAVHHLRKVSSDDYMNEISGTNGLSGAADAILILRRGRGESSGVLNLTGRDVDEAEIQMSFDAQLGCWQAETIPGEQQMGSSRRQILEFVRDHGGATPKDITFGTGLNYNLAAKTCRRMADAGQLVAQGGRYTCPSVLPAGQSRSGVSAGVSSGVQDALTDSGTAA